MKREWTSEDYDQQIDRIAAEATQFGVANVTIEDVKWLLAGIAHLRAENKRLSAQVDALGLRCTDPTEELDLVMSLAYNHAETWRDKDNSYWLARLMQEVGELASSLVGDHDDSPEHELRQIASIALNWLELRAGQGVMP